MSWLEDNGLDFWEEDFSMEEREDDWRSGIHIDIDGNEHKLSEMTISHLKNTIKFFNYLDTTPLEEELKRRNSPE